MRSYLILVFALASVSGRPFAADNIDGEYAKRAKTCYKSVSAPNGLECEAIEEGIAIKRRDGDSFYLHAKTWGASGHSCTYAGIATWKQNRLVAVEENCVVMVGFDKGRAVLTSEGTGCDRYCGARARIYAEDLKKKTP
jgi:hypothetical protein